MEPDSAQWYYVKNDQQFGPFSEKDLKQLITLRKLTTEDLVWKEGLDNWVAAGTVKGLMPPKVVMPPIPTRKASPPSIPTAKPIEMPPTRGVDLSWPIGIFLLVIGIVTFFLIHQEVLPDISVIVIDALMAAYVFFDARANGIGKIYDASLKAYESQVSRWQRPGNNSTGAWASFPLVLGFIGLGIYLRWRHKLKVKARLYPVPNPNGYMTLIAWTVILSGAIGYTMFSQPPLKTTLIGTWDCGNSVFGFAKNGAGSMGSKGQDSMHLWTRMHWSVVDADHFQVSDLQMMAGGERATGFLGTSERSSADTTYSARFESKTLVLNPDINEASEFKCQKVSDGIVDAWTLR